MSKRRSEQHKAVGRPFAKGNRAAAGRTKARWDSWLNTLTGLGFADRDKRQNSMFITDPVTDTQALDLWRGNDLATRIVEDIPSEMLREGFEMRVGGQDAGDEAKEIQEELASAWEELDLQGNLWFGAAYERAYGGGAVMLGAVDGGRPETPLIEERVS